RFMLFLGPVSSLFDFLTFFVMLFAFNASEPLFQTAWFIESLSSQTLVIFVIRTKKSPFWRSKPSRLLLLSSVAIIAFALILPYTPLGTIFQFEKPPATFFIALAAILGLYLAMAEIVKGWFYKRYGYRLEQALIPPRKIGIYFSKTAKLVHNMVAVICLRFEGEISIDSLVEDLKECLGYPLDAEQIFHNLNHMRRGGLISINWHERIVKREKAMKEYVMRHVMGELWPRIAGYWMRASEVLKLKYGRLNSEYLELLNRQLYPKA
ncbi:MAG: cation transporting ATPase C-terminal domain-containing protein, partial [Candidatus Bathyarchaeales archaeon]